MGRAWRISPNINNLGPLGVINSPQGIGFWEEGGVKYAVVTSSAGAMYLITFGASISNLTPGASIILPNVGVSDLRQLKILNDGSGVKAVIAGGASQQVVVADFGSTITNIPKIVGYPVPSANFLTGLDVVRVCGNFFVVTSGYLSGVHVLNFSNSLSGTPDSNLISSVANPLGLSIVQNNNNFYVLVSSSANGIVSLDFGASMTTTNPASTTLGNFGSINFAIGFRILKTGSKYFGCAIDFNDNVFTVLDFPKACSITDNFIDEFQPLASYSSAGTFNVTLRAYNIQGDQSSQTQSIIVSSLVAPDIDFTTQVACAPQNSTFTSLNSSGNINSYAWSFGDATPPANSQNSSHSYSANGNFNVSLNVVATNGCPNFASKSIHVNNVPVASFDKPANVFCINQNYIFNNSTTFDSDVSPEWQWTINGNQISSQKDLAYSFPLASSAQQTVVLVAKLPIPGCLSQASLDIPNVQVGPITNFTSNTASCAGTLVPFTNTTSGSVTGYSWAFGDGNTSTQTNASNAYLTSGVFPVTLTASNAAGCQSTLTQNISIYSNPQPTFAIEAPPFSCANFPAQFDNNTPPLADSNIATWTWSFGDAANGTSAQQNPAYTYLNSGSYIVSLQAVSNFGCKGATLDTVTILPSPQAAFTSNPACVNQNTQFADASLGSITNYQWAVDATMLRGNIPPAYIFKSAGTYPVTLTVTGDNGCKNQITKNITVPVPPLVDFTLQTPCAGDPAIFQELNPSGTDPSIAWNWNFGTAQASGTGSPVSYTFPIPNEYSVTLSTTRESGCVYSVSKNISIYAPPVASFTSSILAGAAPLNVTFNNTSSLADSTFWQFGDAGETTSKNPSSSFTYTQLGEYKVLLTVVNYNGAYSCMDTLSADISVVIPHIDLAVKNFSLTEDQSTNSSKAVVTISNLGNIPFTNPEVDIDLGGNALLKENVTVVVHPGQTVIQTLDLEIVPQSISYICATIIVANDVDIGNDKQCLTLTGEDVVLLPYPNPVRGNINFDWVSSSSENVMVTIYQSNGQVAFEQTFQNVPAGSGQLSINISSLSSGLYLIRFSGAKVQQTFRIIVAN